MKTFDGRLLWLALLKALAPSYLNGRNVNAKVVFANFLLTLTKITSFIYYFLDNMMWVASVGMLPTSAFNHDRWKFWKKVFNLIKNYTQLFRAYLLYKINVRKLVKIEESLSDHSA